MYLYLDIETIPNPETDARLVSSVLDRTPEKKKPELIEKFSFMPMFNKIICIGWGYEDEFETFSLMNSNEALLLKNFNEALWTKGTDGHTVLVTWNGRSFDIPILRMKFAKHQISTPPFVWDEGRYAHDRQIDLRDIVTNYDSYARGNLEEWAMFFGMFMDQQYKHDHPWTGRDILDLYNDQQFEEISEKCKMDIRMTRYIHKQLSNVI